MVWIAPARMTTSAIGLGLHAAAFDCSACRGPTREIRRTARKIGMMCLECVISVLLCTLEKCGIGNLLEHLGRSAQALRLAVVQRRREDLYHAVAVEDRGQRQPHLAE